MKKLRKDYEDIVLEIEGPDTDLKILWPNEKKLCYPKFSSKKLITKTLKSSQLAENVINRDTHQNSEMKISSFNQDLNKNEFKKLDLVKESELDVDTKDSPQKNIFKLEVDEKHLDYLKDENLKKLDVDELGDLKENVSLEILWIQQAIQSRIQVGVVFFF
jgi:hypothetical protein